MYSSSQTCYVMVLTSKVCYVTRSGESVGAAARPKMIASHVYWSLIGWMEAETIMSFSEQRRVIRVSSDLDILEITCQLLFLSQPSTPAPPSDSISCC